MITKQWGQFLAKNSYSAIKGSTCKQLILHKSNQLGLEKKIALTQEILTFGVKK